MPLDAGAATLLDEDARARRAALDVSRSFIVQAPAGSGKTELLTQRFLALLGVVERPEALLAITFTRKAAAEMRNRILEALRGCNDPAAPLRAETRGLAARALQADAHFGWGLLGNPGRLRVQTIDALNQSLARRMPVLSGLGSGLDIDEDGRALHAQAAERLLAHLPAADPRASQAVATLLGHLDNDVGRLVELVGALLARREAWLPVLPADVEAYGETGAVRAALEDGRRAIVEAQLGEIERAFPPALLTEVASLARGAGAVLRELGVESPIGHCADGVPGSQACHLGYWRGLAEFLLTRADAPRCKFTRAVGVLPKAAGRPALAATKARVEAAAAEFARHGSLPGLLGSARRLPPVRYEESEWTVLESLLLVVRLAAAELKAVFAERRTADYAEFAAAARSALGTPDAPTDTALALDARLQHVLVDEFQDTSEAQVALLTGLTAGWQRGDGRTLFLVGDPMQSIYRFRNAEVGLFLDVRDHGLGDLRLEPLTLRVNFRSCGPVVDWVNRCFATVLPPRDDVLRGAVRFAASVAAPSAGDAGGVHVHALPGRDRRREALAVAELVEQRLAECATARIAILVHARSHLVEVVDELSRRRIAFQATDIDPLAARPVVLDLLALTRALAHPGDRAAWLGVLRAPWCGLRLTELHALLADDLHGAVPGLLADRARVERLEPGPRARLERCLSVLESASGERRRLGLRDAVARAWHALGGPATLDSESGLDEARAYFDVLRELEEATPGTTVDLTRLDAALQQLFAPARARPGTRVELLTIHKAKGLQFDTVILPGLDRTPRSDVTPLLRWLKLPVQGRTGLVVAPMAAVGADVHEPLHAWLGQLEEDKVAQEKRRLLYVAATRAERSLHLFGACAIEADGAGHAALRAPRAGCALGLLWEMPEVRQAFEALLAEPGPIADDPKRATARLPTVSRFPEGWSIPQAPTGPSIRTGASRRGVAATRVDFDWASETARHVGTVVHRELQRLARSELRASLHGAAAAEVIERYATELAELGVPVERRGAAAARVHEAVERTLADSRGRWLLGTSHRDARSEAGVTGRLGTELVSAVIDRTFVDACSGVRWIIDYKTSVHEGAGLEQFLDNERERYRAQLERYAALLRPFGAEPIRLGLYFPLLSAWREWEMVEEKGLGTRD